mgnify:CR=1 FL=1
MTTLKYTMSGYRSLLSYSHQRHLLVEGADDKRAFSLFLDELFERLAPAGIESVRIDSAQDLIECDEAGNRQKVEMVCESVSGKPYAERIVGFVDREFREFDRHPDLADSVKGHRISDRLIWSRGHSIENYYFDFDTLRSPLREFSVIDRFRDALALFKAVFATTIRLACAASLAGDEIGMLSLVKGSVGRDVLEVDNSEEPLLTLNLGAWRSNLMARLKASEGIAERLTDRFQYWCARVEEADFHVVRWMCHGHIGLAFIWAVYSRCVLEVCQRHGRRETDAEADARRVLKAEESVRFNACAARWVERSLGDHCSFPIQVFELLGLDLLSQDDV